MKVYIPFNMIVDIDFGIIKFFEKFVDIPEYSINRIKSFLLKRTNENPLPEYCELRKLEISDINTIYNLMMERHYSSILKLSNVTDILSFVINTYKLGLSNQMEITVGCNTELEVKYFKSLVSSLKFSINTDLNSKIKLY